MNDPHTLRQLAGTDPNQAALLLEKICADTPSAEYYTLLAHCLFKSAQYDQAKTAYTQALEYDPTCVSAHFGLAQILQQSEDFAAALNHLQVCLRALPDEGTFLFQAGCCYIQLNQLPEAQQVLEQVLASYPHHLEALVNLGSCFMRQKNFAQAIYYFATACRVDEKHLPALYNLACALMEARRFPQARDHFERYQEQAAEDYEALYHLGFVYLMIDDYVAALRCFHKLLAVNPDNILVLHNLASTALKQHEPNLALNYYQKILTLAPTDDIAVYMHAALAQKNPPPQAPNAYVTALFDHYAERFDEHLTQALHYQTPQLLYEFWLTHNTQDKKIATLLDLGCGTGLMGELFKTHTHTLIGVDLSKEMLRVAEKKSLYDALHEKEIIDYLTHSTTHYDLVILADVLVYLGDCSTLFQELKKITHGVLLSIEHTEQKNYVLSAHGRYQHHVDYIAALCTQHSFDYQIKHNVTLRSQNNQPVYGDLIWAVASSTRGVVE